MVHWAVTLTTFNNELSYVNELRTDKAYLLTQGSQNGW